MTKSGLKRNLVPKRSSTSSFNCRAPRLALSLER